MNIYYSQVIHYGKATMFITGTWRRGKGETIQRWLSLYRDGFRKAHEDGGVWGAPVIKGNDYHRGMGWPAWLTAIGCVRCRISNQNWGIHAPPSLPRCRSFQYYNNKSHKQMKWMTINNRQQEISVAPPRGEGWGRVEARFALWTKMNLRRWNSVIRTLSFELTPPARGSLVLPTLHRHSILLLLN